MSLSLGMASVVGGISLLANATSLSSRVGVPISVVVLGVLTARGHHWARQFLVAWMGLVAALFGVGAVRALGTSAWESSIRLLLVVALAVGAVALWRSRAVDALVGASRVA